jgi:hypothetical protein
VGNLLLARVLLIVVYLGILFLFRRIVKSVEFPETYSIAERMKVLNFFAFQLLLVRDGKYVSEKDRDKEEEKDKDREKGADAMELAVSGGLPLSPADGAGGGGGGGGGADTPLTQLHAELASLSNTDRFFSVLDPEDRANSRANNSSRGYPHSGSSEGIGGGLGDSSSPLHDMSPPGSSSKSPAAPSSASVSVSVSRLAAPRKWVEERVFVEVLDNPLAPQKSMKLL